jgi:hypothetical protein
MKTRLIFAAMQFFAVAAAAAIATALLAPIDAIRFLGVMALLFSGAGFFVELDALRRFDPHAYWVLRHRLRVALKRVRVLGARGAAKLAAARDYASSPRASR